MSTKEFKNDISIVGDTTCSGTITLGAMSIGAAETTVTGSFSDYNKWGALILSGSVANWMTLTSGTTFTFNVAGNYMINSNATFVGTGTGNDERACGWKLRDASTDLFITYTQIVLVDDTTTNLDTTCLAYMLTNVAVNDTIKFQISSHTDGTAEISRAMFTCWKI